MKLHRYFFVSANLDDLEALEKRLEEKGVSRSRIHVLSWDDTAVERHSGLHEVESVMKSDLFHSAAAGLLVGVGASALLLWLTWVFGWNQVGGVGWLPFVFAAIVVLGFFVWEGGLLGIQIHNHHFRAFEQVLNDKKHIFFVDLEPALEAMLDELILAFPSVKKAGTAKSQPRWLLLGKQKISHFLRETLP